MDKVRDVVGLCLNPPEAAVVLCVDEKTQIQALDRIALILPLMPGTPQRQTHDYRRHGTTDLFAALEVASGKVITSMTARHRSEEFRSFLNLIDKQVPDGLDMHIVLDNVPRPQDPPSSAGCCATPASSPRFTPIYSSWMNLVERWFAELTTKWLRHGTHRSVTELKDSINHWTDNPKPFVWHKTADEIFDTMAAYMQPIPHSGH